MEKKKKVKAIQTPSERCKAQEILIADYRYTIARHQEFFRGLMKVAVSTMDAQKKIDQIVSALNSMKADLIIKSHS